MTTIKTAQAGVTQIETGRWIAIFDAVAVTRDDGQLAEFDTEAEALAYLETLEDQAPSGP